MGGSREAVEHSDLACACPEVLQKQTLPIVAAVRAGGIIAGEGEVKAIKGVGFEDRFEHVVAGGSGKGVGDLDPGAAVEDDLKDNASLKKRDDDES